MKIAKEGLARAAAALILACILLAVSVFSVGMLSAAGGILALLLLFIAAFLLYFFRDPDREHPAGEGIVLSPADGRVMDVTQNAGVITVRIFMSPLDVHVQRSPVSGVVESVEYTPGKFMRAYDPKAYLENERNSIKIMDDNLHGYEVVQIAGIIARRIVCRTRAGARVSRGERIGMIMLGSQVNLRMPGALKVHVKPGDRVTAGVSIVGKTVS
jgi:phosphatidylserine decarboxylase